MGLAGFWMGRLQQWVVVLSRADGVQPSFAWPVTFAVSIGCDDSCYRCYHIIISSAAGGASRFYRCERWFRRTYRSGQCYPSIHPSTSAVSPLRSLNIGALRNGKNHNIKNAATWSSPSCTDANSSTSQQPLRLQRSGFRYDGPS